MSLPAPATSTQPRSKRWTVYPSAPAAHFTDLAGLSPVVVQILYNRGITDRAEAAAFLQPDRLSPADSLFKLKGMTQSVERIRRAIRAHEPIAVYGDYDVDGVTATALLVQTLASLGAVVQPYIPHRVDEGYGLNTEALQTLQAAGIKLVITVDCGVRSIPEVAFAKSIGLDLIVSDHHMPSDQLPDAFAVINPKQPGCPYPFKELAGVGLAFKIAQGLLAISAKNDLPPTAVTEDELLDLVALGTVADLAPLLGENRSLVAHGLDRLRRTTRPGLRALLAVGKVKAIDTTAIGFTLGPRLNASGRLDHALKSYQLLMTNDEKEADRLALDLDIQNRERQALTKVLTDKARALALAQPHAASLIFVADPEFKAGVVGLVAGRLAEEFYRPAIIVERGESESRGSCRSIPEFHITRALDECAELFVHHGGHAAAAGFTIETAKLDALVVRMHAIAERVLGDQELQPTLSIDAEVELKQLTPDLFNALQQTQPHGYANPAPIFVSRNLTVLDARAVGADNGHLKLRVSDDRTPWDAIAFRLGSLAPRLQRGARIDLAYTFEENEWNGVKSFQLNVKDIKRNA